MRTHTERKAHKTARPAAAAVEYYSRKLEFELGPYGLREIMDRLPGAVCLIDVRTPEEFAEGHIPGARSIPLAELAGKAASLPRDRTIVTYCGDITCPLSSVAALQLARKGLSVKHLLGGIVEWTRKGYAVQPSGESLEGPME